MNLDEANILVKRLYEKYSRKELKRNKLVCKLVKEREKLQYQITKENFDVNNLKSKIQEENLKINEDKKFIKGFFLRLIAGLLLSLGALLLIKESFVTIICYALMLLIMGKYSVSFVRKNGHLPFRDTNKEYLEEIQNNLDNKITKREILERKNKKITKVISVYSRLDVYNKALRILKEIEVALNNQIGFEKLLTVPEENIDIEWLNDMERKLKREE